MQFGSEGDRHYPWLGVSWGTVEGEKQTIILLNLEGEVNPPII